MFAEAKKWIVGGVNSAARAFKGLEMTPLMAKRGEAALLYDTADRPFIDYCQSWGALILGHRPERVLQEIEKQLRKGWGFGMTTEIEVELARHVANRVPFVEKMRFVSTGTEAVMTALRMARGFTGKSIVVKFDRNYHGHHDSLHTDTVSLPYNDLEAAKEFFARGDENIAAVILEPIAGNMGVIPTSREFLLFLRDITKEIGALLIFDEVITGFRVAKGGAAELYQIEPDLVTYGKIIGGGLPAAAVGGSEEIMSVLAPVGPVFQAGTLSGNPLAMTCGLATLLETEEEGFYEDLERKTEEITKDLPMVINQVGSMFSIFLGPEKVTTSSDIAKVDFTQFKEFYHFIYSKGIFFPPSPYESCFISKAHTEEQIKLTKEIILEGVCYGKCNV